MKKGCCKTKVEQQSFFLWWLPGRQHHRGGNAAGCDVGGYRKRREGNRAYQLPILPVMAVGPCRPAGCDVGGCRERRGRNGAFWLPSPPVMAVGPRRPAGCDVGGYRERREGNRAYQLPSPPVMAVGAATPPGVLLVAAGSGEEEMERTSFRHHPLRPSARADPTCQYFKLSRIRQSAVRRSDSR